MANDLVPSGDDGSLVVSVDSRKAIAGLSALEGRVYGFVHSTQTQFNRVSGTMNNFYTHITNISNGFRGLFARLAGFFTFREAIQGIKGFISRIADVNRVFTGFVASMTIIRGSAGAAQKEYQFLLNISDKLGTSIESTISQYHRLAAALKNVDSSGQLARHVFTGISEAALVLQSRGHDTTLIFEAIQQMASKGKLSLEELQRQLGNTLPGAVSMAARAMMNSKQFIDAGVKTVAESEQFLRKSIQKGTINVYEFLARIANQLKKEYGGGVEYASSQFQANLNRMQNSVFELYRVIGSSGAIKGMVSLMRELTGLFNDANGQGAAGLGQALGDMFEDMAKWVSNLSSNDIMEFFAAIKTAVVTTGTVVGDFFDLFSFFSGSEIQTPLLNFVEFIARTMAALVDIFRVAIAGIETVIRGFIGVFQTAQEMIYAPRDWAIEANSNIRGFLGVDADPNAAAYWEMRAQQKRDRDANDAAFSRSQNMWAHGPEGGNTYDKVVRQFAEARTELTANRYGVDPNKSVLDFTLGFPQTEKINGMPTYLLPNRKAGSTAEDASNYVNPMGDSELQKFIDSLGGGAPNSGSNGGGGRGKTENAYMRESTRLLKELATADNEYQNVLEGRNRKEGEREAQMRSLIATDERYSKMSKVQQEQLLSWARQVDEANQKVRDAVKVQGAWNDALLAGYDAQRQIAQLENFGYASKYNAEAKARESFMEGGENQFMDPASKAKYLESQAKVDNDKRRLDMAEYAASIRQANEEMLFQANILNMSSAEQDRLTQFRKIDLMVQQLSVGATDEMIEAYRKMGETLKTEVGGALDYVNSKQSSMYEGIQRALSSFEDQAANVAQATFDVASNAFSGLTDIIGQFVVTGKANFGDFVKSVIADFARMEARIILSQVFKWVANWAMSYFTGGVDVGYGTAQGNYEWASNSGFGNNYGNFAKGGVFTANPSLKAYSSGVYDTPQFFQQYAKGGVFAEAGAEAIMPLARDSSGELGVKVKDGSLGGGQEINLTIQTVVNADGSSKTASSGDQAGAIKEFSNHMAQVAQSEIQKSMRPGGTLWKAGVTIR